MVCGIGEIDVLLLNVMYPKFDKWLDVCNQCLHYLLFILWLDFETYTACKKSVDALRVIRKYSLYVLDDF